MVDITLLMESMPLTLPQFEELVKSGCAKSKEILSESWVFQCAKIVNDRKDQLEQMMPTTEASSISFFDYVRFYIVVLYSGAQLGILEGRDPVHEEGHIKHF